MMLQSIVAGLELACGLRRLSRRMFLVCAVLARRPLQLVKDDPQKMIFHATWR
jgi:hypothetical protein